MGLCNGQAADEMRFFDQDEWKKGVDDQNESTCVEFGSSFKENKDDHLKLQ